MTSVAAPRMPAQTTLREGKEPVLASLIADRPHCHGSEQSELETLKPDCLKAFTTVSGFGCNQRRFASMLLEILEVPRPARDGSGKVQLLMQCGRGALLLGRKQQDDTRRPLRVVFRFQWSIPTRNTMNRLPSFSKAFSRPGYLLAMLCCAFGFTSSGCRAAFTCWATPNPASSNNTPTGTRYALRKFRQNQHDQAQRNARQCGHEIAHQKLMRPPRQNETQPLVCTKTAIPPLHSLPSAAGPRSRPSSSPARSKPQ